MTFLLYLPFFSDTFLEGLLITLAMQYPLPNFPITQWNSIEKPLTLIDQTQIKDFLKSTVFITTPGALISFQKPPTLKEQNNESINFTTRTVVGRHAWSISTETVTPSKKSPANAWLKSLSIRSPQQFEEARRNGSQQKQRSPPTKELLNPFEALPDFSSAMSASERAAQAQQAMDMLAFIRRSNRRPIKNFSTKNNNKENIPKSSALQAWRKFAADFSFIKSTQSATTNFPRELKHLDNTSSREVHKIAVIYVAEGQDDKQSILSNTNGSLHFNYFVEGLGWPVQIGSSTHLGYSGGLSAGQTCPYFSTVDTEVIFHVSTQLSGDAQMKMKHLGNDEVHVIL
uniref:Rap-GAP domain-containing protein n=1 Tax=Panagrolaimus davidi TaxID=227884 RepID=A0A914PTF8_9BILA